MAETMKDYTFNERDEFNRKQIAEKISTLLSSSVDVSPMVIDGSWGTGKTEFCYKLINLMAQAESHHLIYVDAFQADHADEPLLTVLAEVIKILPDEEAQQNFIQKALPAARYGLKTLGKAAIAHLLRQDVANVVDDFDKEIQQVANKTIDASVEAVLQDHVKASESLATLQTTLKELAEDKPIVLFIDELDRCRPDFAVHMLEIIKHTFDVEGVQFVLVTNTQQLKASINHCYGSTVDAARYLDKFLKFSFTLPTEVQARMEQVLVSKRYFSQLLNESDLLRELGIEQAGYLSLFEELIEVKNLSLREVERLIRCLEIYQAITQNNIGQQLVYGHRLLILLGIALYSTAPSLCIALSNRQADAADFSSALGLNSLPQKPEGFRRPKILQSLGVTLAQECQHNNDLYTPTDAEEKEYWSNSFNDYFDGGFHAPDAGRRHSRIIETINTMNLNN